MAPSHQQAHQACRHLAVAEALLRGYAAEIQGPQTYIKVNGRSAAVVVAGKGAWMIADIEKFTSRLPTWSPTVTIAPGPARV